MNRRSAVRTGVGAVVAAATAVAGAVLAPGAGAHPDPLDKEHHRAETGVVVRVNAPTDLAGDLAAVQWADTGALDGQTADLVYAGSGCSPLSYAGVDVAGRIALVDDEASDPCPVATFAQKVQSAEQAGAIGLVSVPADGAEPNANATAVTASIPALEVYRTDAVVAMRDAVLAGEAVNVTLADTREPLSAASDLPCTDGKAGPFDCDGIDLLSFVPQETFDGAGVSDLWGWTDPETRDEYVMLGKTNGTGFFRVTDPFDPVYLGELPNPSPAPEVWHDIKVYENHAFIVSESMSHGMLIFDLTRLRDVTEPQVFEADTTYPLVSSAHNVAINEDTGFAYVVGGNAALVLPDQCLSGLHMIDVRDPKNPSFAGCYLLDGGPGTAARTAGLPVGAAYVHDTQCVVYDGPDTRYTGRELCFNASEDQVTIADVTDKVNPVTVGTTDYDGIAYAHQGWLTEDHRYLLTNDELDETSAGTNTRTVVLDVTDLEDPTVHFVHTHETTSIDHNNYVRDGFVYQSNYTSGLRVLDLAAIGDADDPRLEHHAFFDVFPYSEGATFDGTWSNYPYFESGTIAVSGMGEGLFLLRLSDGGTSGDVVEVSAAGAGVPTLRSGVLDRPDRPHPPARRFER